VTMSLAGTAILARHAGKSEIALRLLTFVERGREDSQFVGATPDLESQQHLLTRLERDMDPVQFATVRAEGRSMTLDDAVALALDVLRPIADGD
jgi:hypothetical protein